MRTNSWIISVFAAAVMAVFLLSPEAVAGVVSRGRFDSPCPNEENLRWTDVASSYTRPPNRAAAIDDALNKAQWYRSAGPAPGASLEPGPAKATRPDTKRPTSRSRTVGYIAASSRKKAPRYDDISFTKTKAVRAADATESRRNSNFRIGAETFRYAYQEPGVMKQRGTMNGIFGTLTYRFREQETWEDVKANSYIVNMLRLDGRFTYGELDYESDSSGEDNGIPNYTLEIRVLFGCDLPVEVIGRITPYAGVGYRYLLDDDGGRLTSKNTFGYDRESQYWYIPLGVETETVLNDQWTIGLNAEYDFLIRGVQKSHIGDGGEYNVLYSGYPVVENTQDGGIGIRGGLTAAYHTRRLDFVLEPFARYWQIAESKKKTVSYNGMTDTWVEPKNNTTEFGVRMGLQF